VSWTRANRYGDFELHFFDDEAAAIPPLDGPRRRVRVSGPVRSHAEGMPPDPHDPATSPHP
jgi:hypothetical protein